MNYVYKILKVFGVYEEEIVTGGESNQSSIEDALTPLMNALSQYRD